MLCCKHSKFILPQDLYFFSLFGNVYLKSSHGFYLSFLFKSLFKYAFSELRSQKGGDKSIENRPSFVT